MKHALPLFALPFLVAPAAAADIHVPAEQPTIEAAISAASPGDRIIVADGTYGGSGFANLDPEGKDLRVVSAAGADACTLDGSRTPGANAFCLHSGESSLSRIAGFTFPGFLTGPGGEGAIRVTGGSSVQILDNVFVNCATAGPGQATTPGSAIAMVDSSPVVQRCQFIGNTGSAVHNVNSVSYLIDCLFEDNVTRPADGRGGGAVLNEGFTLTFTSTYRGNRVEAAAGAARGGAIAHLGSFADLTTATFEDNAVTGPAGASGAAVHLARPFVMNGNVLRNHAGVHAGGAVHVDGTDAGAPSESFATAVYEDNAIGGLLVEDPAGLLLVRVASSHFCGNDIFDIAGPYVAGGGKDVCCPGDLDGSGAVDAVDFLALIAAWGSGPELPPAIER